MSDFNPMGDLAETTINTGGPMKPGDYPATIMSVEKTTSEKSGWTQMVVEMSIANGEFEGRKLTTRYLWDQPRNSDGVIIPTDEKVGIKMANDGNLSYEEAEEAVLNGWVTAVKIGKEGFKKLINAAGFIDMKDTKPGDKNITRIEAGLATEIPDDFTLDTLVGRVIMVATKTGTNTNTGNEYQEVKRVWDVNPAEVGDLATAAPF